MRRLNARMTKNEKKQQQQQLPQTKLAAVNIEIGCESHSLEQNGAELS